MKVTIEKVLLFADEYHGRLYRIQGTQEAPYELSVSSIKHKGLWHAVGSFRLFDDACRYAEYYIDKLIAKAA